MDSDARVRERTRRLWFIAAALFVLVIVAATGARFIDTPLDEGAREGNVVVAEERKETNEEAEVGASIPPNNGFVSTGECPLYISGGNAESFRSNGFGRAWSYVSDGDLEDLASAVLMELHDEGWSLIRSEHLDLYGDAWGCVAQDQGNSRVLLVHIRPRILELSKSRENELDVSIVELSDVG